MKTRCKFVVNSLTDTMGSKKNKETGSYEPAIQRSVKMSPVYGNNDPNHENTKFWEASPCGQFELSVINLAAAEIFVVGKEYYLDISPA